MITKEKLNLELDNLSEIVGKSIFLYGAGKIFFKIAELKEQINGQNKNENCDIYKRL